MHRLQACLFGIILFFSNLACATPSTTAADIFAFKRIAQVLASPDGNQVAFIVFEVNPSSTDKNWHYSLYLKNQEGITLILSKHNSISALNWSPDGQTIAYLSKGKKFKSIWSYTLANHQETKLIEFDSPIEKFKWSLDGKMLAFIASVSKNKKRALSALIDVNQDYTINRLFLVKTLDILPVTATALTPLDYHIIASPTDNGFDWSADNKSIAFAYLSSKERSAINSSHIGIIDLLTHTIKPIIYTQNHAAKKPFYSPDGKWLAYISTLPPNKIAPLLNNNLNINARVCVTELLSQKSHCLANTFNESPSIIGWNSSSNKIYVLDAYKSSGNLIYALNLTPTVPAKLISKINGFIEPLTLTLNFSHQIFGFSLENMLSAPQAFISQDHPFNLQQITAFANNANLTLGHNKTISWHSTDGVIIEGLLTTPAHYNPSKAYPLLVLTHGGPAGVWSKRYLGGCDEYAQMIDPTTCWQHSLNLGFIILQPNPRGSSGYGYKFRMANFADFGGGDYRDIMSGVDFLIDTHIANPDHLAIAGWSYGGYLAAWAISQSNRFKAAVAGNGNMDLISFVGTSDIPYFIPEYLGNNYWDNYLLFYQRSPIAYATNMNTPILILAGKNDIRVPVTQSYELYTALKILNKPVKMLILPDQEHVPTHPKIIEASLNEIDMWLRQAL